MQNIVKILIAVSFLFTMGNTSDIDVNKIVLQANKKSKNISIEVFSEDLEFEKDD